MRTAFIASLAGLMLVSTVAIAPALAQDMAGGAVKVATVGGQEILTDANGMTLYIFDRDNPGVTNCYDKCAVNWPPAMAAADAKAEGDFTLVDRTDGGKMWAYKSMPLYLWIKDTKPGETTGDGVNQVWHTAVK
jgi:predicted lipoprotein with Yx(FWY)xxD motif